MPACAGGRRPLDCCWGCRTATPPNMGDESMHVSLRFQCLPFLALVLAVPAITADQEKKPASQAKENEKIKPDWSAEIPGMLMDFNDSDDTGEFIKLTKELVAKAKGREGYPGYEADSKILRNGQYVYVYVWKDTKTPASLLLDKNKQATMKPEELQAELRNFRYDVIMIYVVAQAPPSKNLD
jgi:hypothetical protein